MSAPLRAPLRAPARVWYREPYLWLVLAPLLVTVAASFVTLGIAIRAGGGEVIPGDYVQAGKLASLDAGVLERSMRMAEGASARLSGDGRVLRVTVPNAAEASALTATVLHPTDPARDLTVLLQREGDAFVAGLPADSPRRGTLQVRDFAGQWRLGASFEPGAPLALAAAGH